MIINIELLDAELYELRQAMYSHIQNIEIFFPGIELKRYEALASLTEKFKDILNESDSTATN